MGDLVCDNIVRFIIDTCLIAAADAATTTAVPTPIRRKSLISAAERVSGVQAQYARCRYADETMDVSTKTLILPTPEELNEIYRELGMSEDKINVEVKAIAEWMRKQPHLPNPESKKKIFFKYL